MDFFDFIFYFIAFIILISKFEIIPIKSKICDLKIIDKEIIYENNITDDIIDRIIQIKKSNSTFVEMNYIDKLYKIRLYENDTHILAHICEDIDENKYFEKKY